MKKLIYALPLVLALGACSNEESVTAPVETDGPTGYYLSLDLRSVGTIDGVRNTTENDGTSTEEFAGQTKENSLETATIYFYKEDGTVLKTFNDEIINSSASPEHTVYFKLGSIDDLFPLCQGATGKVYVAVVGNATKNNFTHDLTGSTKVGDAKMSSVFTSGKVAAVDFGLDSEGQILPLASTSALDLSDAFKDISTTDDNAKRADLRAKFVDSYTYNNGQGQLWKINASNKVELERGVARIDFKDRTNDVRKAESASLDGLDYCYLLGKRGDVIIKLQSITTKNVLNSAYLFRHTTTAGSASGASGDIQLFGVEKGNSGGYNWVASADWTSVSAIPASRSYADEVTVPISSLTSRPLVGTEDDKNYKPVAYVTETTVPTRALMTDANVTSLKFKFQIMTADGSSPLGQNLANKPSCITKETETSLRITMPDGKSKVINWDVDGYYMVFTGMLKHNDAAEAAMEYGVVRNNAYQCSVAEVVDPDGWTDAADMYLQLDVKVQPWQKRANEFKF